MQRHYHVCGIGAALLDTEIAVSDHELNVMGVKKGIMTVINKDRENELMTYLKDHSVSAKRLSGGSVCNSMVTASYFGAKCFYICKVADDENGHFYLADLKAAGVDSYFDRQKQLGRQVHRV